MSGICDLHCYTYTKYCMYCSPVKLTTGGYNVQTLNISVVLAKLLYNRNMVSAVHFNHFSCIMIFDTSIRHLAMLTYINVDES